MLPGALLALQAHEYTVSAYVLSGGGLDDVECSVYVALMQEELAHKHTRKHTQHAYCGWFWVNEMCVTPVKAGHVSEGSSMVQGGNKIHPKL